MTWSSFEDKKSITLQQAHEGRVFLRCNFCMKWE